MSLLVRSITPSDRNEVRSELIRHWSSPQIWSLGRRYDADQLPGFVAEIQGRFAGLITVHFDPGGWQCEVITLSSRSENRGVGAALLRQAELFARDHGCRRVFLTTTNDNTRAIRFYQRRGWRFAALHRGIVDRVRIYKPELPLLGFDDIPIRDEIEFELWLDGEPQAQDERR